MLELGLRGNKYICKVAVYSHFVGLLQNKTRKHCSKFKSASNARGEVALCPFRKPFQPGLGESQEVGGTPSGWACSLQPHSSETSEVVAVKDFTDDN
jgi:hypothetical protein